MLDTSPTAQEGYGSFGALESATVPDAQSFFEKYYASGNAVLSVSGDIDVAEATRLIELHFGDVPARPAPARPDFNEPDVTGERREAYVDRPAPPAAVASSWPGANPIHDF